MVEDVSTARVATLLLDLRNATHREGRRATGFLRRHSCDNVLTDLLLEMLAQLFSHFFICLVWTKNRAESRRQGIEPLFQVHFRPLSAGRCQRSQRRRDSSLRFLSRAASVQGV